MLCALSIRQEQNARGTRYDMLEHAYVEFLEKQGLELLIIPNTTQNVDHYFEHFPIERVILTGGNDVDPEWYGAPRREGLTIVPERDRIEKRMIELAVQKNIPLLGICRGMQFLNVYCGGKLVDIREVYRENAHSPGKDHSVKLMIPWFKDLTMVPVNSYHNQGLRMQELSPQLRAFALTEEGIVEGICHPRYPLAGIQWHPERKSPDPEFNRALIKAFVKGELFWKRK